jgi:hypothetical protein
MNAAEEKQISELLDKESSVAQQKAALTWIRNYLEEGDILNLPASRRSLEALKQFSGSRSGDASLMSRAKRLLKQYER